MMRKSVSVTLLLTLIFTALFPSFAQKGSSDRPGFKEKARTQFGEVRVLTEGSGVLVRWEMASEASTAGYNVYRIDPDGKALVNEAMVVGSWARSGEQVAYGESYQVFDPDGTVDSNYVIEGRRIDGGRFTSGRFPAALVESMETEAGISVETLLNVARSANRNVEQRSSALTAELADIVSSTTQQSDVATHRWVVSQPGAKIGVRKDGFYRITAAVLQGASFPVNSDSSKWRLFLNGVEQSIIVAPGGQYIEFYGKGVDLPETDTRIYYLIADTVSGKRIGTKVLRPIAGNTLAKNYAVTANKDERLDYYKNLFNGEEDNFLGRLIYDVWESIPFTLTGLDTSVPEAVVTVNLWGYSRYSHLVRVRINGHDLPDMTSFGVFKFSSTHVIPVSYLLEGNNTLELTSPIIGDFSTFKSISVQYARKFEADQNKISFFTPGYKKVDLTGFNSPDVRVFDMTFDGSPTQITNLPVVQAGGTYTVKMPSSRTMVGYAIDSGAMLQSPSVTANTPSDLSATTNGADMLIISYSSPNFMAAAETWADYRRSPAGGGLNVKVVNVTDIFDEFNFGLFGAAGVKAFLQHAHSAWQAPPVYVLLLGDSSFDPRNYQGFGAFDFVPSAAINLVLSEGYSDEALGDFDNDGLAEMAIGRIPARTPSAITTAFNKTTNFETPALQSLSRGALFAHDLPNGFNFASMSQIMSSQLPVGTPVAMVDRASPTAQQDLITQMNSGKFIINYSGHGAAGLWASSSFFSVNSVPQLTNGNSPSIYNMLTCLNGYFLRPNADSLSEVLLQSVNGGAVAAWASTAETTPDIQLIMGTRFYNQLATGNFTRMGDLIKDAKTAIPAGADVRLSWVLLGDPTLKIR